MALFTAGNFHQFRTISLTRVLLGDEPTGLKMLKTDIASRPSGLLNSGTGGFINSGTGGFFNSGTSGLLNSGIGKP